MLKTKVIVILALLTLNLISCKKDKQTNAACILNETNLVGTYSYGPVTYKATPSSPAVNATSMVDACSLDDIIKLGANHVFTYTDAGVKCTPPGDGTSTWSLQGNIFTANSQSAIIDNFTCTSFTIANADLISTGDTLLITFKRQ